MINFYRIYIPNAAAEQLLLNNFLKGSKKNDKRKIQWTDDSIEQFELSKKRLCEATHLSHPSPNATLAVKVDASDFAIGAVIQQRISDN